MRATHDQCTRIEPKSYCQHHEFNVSALPEHHLRRWVAVVVPASANHISVVLVSTNQTVSDSSLASLLPSWFSPLHPRVIGRRTHEFSHASDHSIHCWAHIVVLISSVPGHGLSGCQGSKLIHQILQSTFLQEFGLVFLQVTNDLRGATRLIQVRSFMMMLYGTENHSRQSPSNRSHGERIQTLRM